MMSRGSASEGEWRFAGRSVIIWLRRLLMLMLCLDMLRFMLLAMRLLLLLHPMLLNHTLHALVLRLVERVVNGAIAARLRLSRARRHVALSAGR